MLARFRTRRGAVADAPAPPPSPGWYRDPSDPELKRYWDGGRWKNTTVPATGLPELPDVPHPDDEWVSRPVFDVIPAHPHHRHWTPSRIVVIVLGGLGWAGFAVGLLVLLTDGEISVLTASGAGIAVLVLCALLAAAFYSMDRLYSIRASRRARRLFGLGWLAAIVIGVALAITNL